MAKSSRSPCGRKDADRPAKPYPDFPLTPHASGAWQKKIRGRIYYFGKWGRRVDGKLVRVEGDGWEDALAEYKKVADDLHAGRAPRASADGLTVADLCNHFLNAKLRKVEAGEMGVRSFRDYKDVTDLIASHFGKGRLVEDLAADDFAQLRAAMAKKWGPVRLANAVTRVKSVFKYGTDNGLVERTVRYGSEFKKPEQSVLRRHRASKPARMFEADEVRALVEGALVAGEAGPELVRPDATLRAMILLGVNCAFGNTDLAGLRLANVDLAGGWIDFPRPKTGIARRCPLWPETVAGIRGALAERPEPAGPEFAELTFLSARGNAYIKSTDYSHKDLLTIQFTRHIRQLGIHKEGIGFYALRHTFRTVADDVRDGAAVDLIMGHTDPSMAAHYRERIDDARLRAVADRVRAWVWPAPTGDSRP